VIEIINYIGRSPITWILDYGASSYICACMQDLQTSRPLQKRGIVLRVGNRASIDPLAIGISSVTLSTRHVLKIKDCLYV